jgi:hypothetical protein
MTPDLVGRLQTRALVFLVAVLPLTAALAAATDLGGQPGAAALFVLYWLPVGLAAEGLYAAEAPMETVNGHGEGSTRW